MLCLFFLSAPAATYCWEGTFLALICSLLLLIRMPRYFWLAFMWFDWFFCFSFLFSFLSSFLSLASRQHITAVPDTLFSTLFYHIHHYFTFLPTRKTYTEPRIINDSFVPYRAFAFPQRERHWRFPPAATCPATAVLPTCEQPLADSFGKVVCISCILFPLSSSSRALGSGLFSISIRVLWELHSRLFLSRISS